jgi:hypothetical protein
MALKGVFTPDAACAPYFAQVTQDGTVGSKFSLSSAIASPQCTQ